MTRFSFLILAALPAALLGQPDRFGSPACQGPELELADRTFFTVCHDSSLKAPVWAGHELRPGQLQPAGERSRSRHFRRDVDLAGPSARNEDYRGSGYARGHLVPAEDFAASDEARRATYVLSNAVPQDPRVNGGMWRQLESAVRAVAACADATYVFTGALFDRAHPENIGESGVAVPTHTYKVVLAINGNNKIMYAAILPNAPTNGAPLESFTTTVEQVERRTGLNFFSGLEDEEERRLEAAHEPVPTQGVEAMRAACSRSAVDEHIVERAGGRVLQD